MTRLGERKINAKGIPEYREEEQSEQHKLTAPNEIEMDAGIEALFLLFLSIFASLALSLPKDLK